MPDPSPSRFDVSLERLSKIAGILVPIVIALVGCFYTLTKDKNDAADLQQKAEFDQTQRRYANLTALLPLLTSDDEAKFDLGVQIYTSEANAKQAPADQLQGYIQARAASNPGDPALQRAEEAGDRQQVTDADHPKGFGVIISGDKKDDVVIQQVKLLKAQNIADLAVYDRHNSLRTVARFPSLAAATQAQQEIQKKRPEAYVVNLAKWCPAPAPDRTLEDVPVLKCP